MKEKIMQENAEDLKVLSEAKLKANEIITLGELSNHKKSQLKNFGLQQNEISKIEVELELLGLSLKGSL